MKWTAAMEDDTTLRTPVVTLNSPFSEICEMAFRSDTTSGGVTEGNSKQQFKTKRKLKCSSRIRNELHRRIGNHLIINDDADDESRESKRPKTTSADSRPKVKLKKRELFSLQLQRAMIADEDGDRPIHIAVAQEDVALVEKLCFVMKNGSASLDLANHLRQTALHVAVIVGNSEVVNILLRNGASVHCQDRHGCNAIHLAIKYFREKTFASLMDHSPSTSALDAFDYDGFSALHHAVTRRNEIAVNGLFRAGADIDSVDGKSGRSCLAHAVLACHIDMVTILLECKARVDRTDYSGQTALEMALNIGNRTVIDLLEKENPSLKPQSGSEMSEDGKYCFTSSTVLPEKKRKKHKRPVDK